MSTALDSLVCVTLTKLNTFTHSPEHSAREAALSFADNNAYGVALVLEGLPSV